MAFAATQTRKRTKKTMKRILLSVLILAVLSISGKALAQYEKTIGLGVHTGYGHNIKNIGGGVHLHYYCTNEIRFAPSFTYFLERKGNKVWIIDADTHAVLPLTWLLSLYPIGGINYSHSAFDASKTANESDRNWIKNRVGANLGLGIQYDVRYKVRVNIEYKYQFIKNASQSFFTAGIGFWI